MRIQSQLKKLSGSKGYKREESVEVSPVKKVLWIDARRTIRQTFSKFIALFAIVVLGIAFFVGVSASAPIMGQSVDKYNDENKLMDFQVYANYGLDEEDLAALSDITGIQSVQGVKMVDAIGVSGEKEHTLRITSFSKEQEINQVELVEGRMPQKDTECLAEISMTMQNDFEVGEKVRISLPSGDIKESLSVTEFTVVGLVISPDYLATERGESSLNNRSLSTFLLVSDEVFVNDIYSSALLLAEGALELNSFLDEYEVHMESIKEELDNEVEELQKVRATKVKEEALAEYEEGLTEYEEGVSAYEEGLLEYENGNLTYNNELMSGETDLANALDAIESGEKALSEGRQKLQNSQTELDAGIEEGLREIEAGEAQIQEGQGTLEQSLQVYEESKPELLKQIESLVVQKSTLEEIIQKLQEEKAPVEEIEALEKNIEELMRAEQEIRVTMEATEQELANAQSQLEEEQLKLNAAKLALEETRKQGQSEIDSGWVALNESESELAEAKKEYENGVLELENGRIEGKDELVEAELELDEAKLELDEAKKELESGKADIDELEEGEWTVLDRTMHGSTVQYKDTVAQMGAIAAVFPMFFFLVAALVCSTTMTRMVDEQRGQMGILRALGYSNFDCALKFLYYSLTATALGGVVGTVVGMVVFPPIIYSTWGLLFSLPKLQYDMPLNYIVIGNLLFLILMCGTTAGVTWKQLRDVPSQILRPKAPKMGKTVVIEKITFVWKRMSFTSKVTARNLIRYKRRFFMTVIGISGCTALLVSGFGIRESVSNIVPLQYEELNQYDGSIRVLETLEEDQTIEVKNQISQIEGVSDIRLVSEYDLLITSKHVSSEYVAQVHVTADESTDQLLNTIRERKTKEELNLSDGEIILSEKLSELLQVEVGDRISIENQNEIIQSFIIGGINERYILHEVFMTQNTYKEAFDESAKLNTMQLVLEENVEDIHEELEEVEGIETIYLFESTIEDMNNRVEGINVIVYLIIVCAAALAFIVLGNLTNINISERQRELATLKVLGFTDKEVNTYMFKENMVLTFFGALLGLLLGTILHRFIITLVEMEFVMFLRETTVICFVLAFVITFVFSLTVNAIVTRKLKKIQMVESLKSVE